MKNKKKKKQRAPEAIQLRAAAGTQAADGKQREAEETRFPAADERRSLIQKDNDNNSKPPDSPNVLPFSDILATIQDQMQDLEKVQRKLDDDRALEREREREEQALAQAKEKEEQDHILTQLENLITEIKQETALVRAENVDSIESEPTQKPEPDDLRNKAPAPASNASPFVNPDTPIPPTPAPPHDTETSGSETPKSTPSDPNPSITPPPPSPRCIPSLRHGCLRHYVQDSCFLRAPRSSSIVSHHHKCPRSRLAHSHQAFKH